MVPNVRVPKPTKRLPLGAPIPGFKLYDSAIVLVLTREMSTRLRHRLRACLVSDLWNTLGGCMNTSLWNSVRSSLEENP